MDACEIAVRLQPGSRRTEIAGERNGSVLVRVTAPPVDGRANSALRRLLAKRAGLAVRNVSIVHGANGRAKLVRFEGIGCAALRDALGLTHDA